MIAREPHLILWPRALYAARPDNWHRIIARCDGHDGLVVLHPHPRGNGLGVHLYATEASRQQCALLNGDAKMFRTTMKEVLATYNDTYNKHGAQEWDPRSRIDFTEA